MSLRDAISYSSIVAYTGNVKITELASKEVSIPLTRIFIRVIIGYIIL